MKNFEELNSLVIQWAEERGIFDASNPERQLDKTREEVEELGLALNHNDMEQTIDGIGDVLVTIILLAKMKDLNPVECLEYAYEIINKRTGKMVNGLFVKDNPLS